MIADSASDDLLSILTQVNRVSEKYGFRLNAKKTKFTTVRRNDQIFTNLDIGYMDRDKAS